ncbi:hypothetical protein EDD15DRAFT_2390391 [Pisolithus albus]|nr:hypothetical protein EDD15DRAFT_2390391 [Pisolithus albus]
MDDCWQYQSFFALGLGFSVLHHSASESMLTSPNTFESSINVPRTDDIASPVEALVLAGYLSPTPISPTIAISISTLELYRLLRLRKPSFSVEAYTKVICDLYKWPYRRRYRNAIANAFDVYLAIKRIVDGHVAAALGRDTPDWRVKNACPPCRYKVRLQDEPKLKYSCMLAFDGNNSLSRMTVAAGRQVGDQRVFYSDYFLDKDYVNLFANEVAGHGTEDSDHDNRNNTDTSMDTNCTDNWKAAAADSKKKSWGIFEETGIFACACHHGMVQWVADMIQSGELFKYPLAMIDKALSTLGDRLLIGYDIACKLSVTIGSSSLDAFHGYSHNYSCQDTNHPNVIEGAGLEDFGMMERIFSMSNQLASDRYLNLGQTLHRNYLQALQIIRDETEAIEQAKRSLGVSDQDLTRWKIEQSEYLKSCHKEPEWDALAVAYVELLQKMRAYRSSSESANASFLHATPASYAPASENSYYAGLSQTRKLETAHRVSNERYTEVLQEVNALEVKMGITRRWDVFDAQYIEVAKHIGQRKYIRALKNLQRLVVLRLFELHKLNLSRTGYKMRTHIAKSLQTRCKAIRHAIKVYNDAAVEIGCPTVDWSRVSHYAFLEEFTLLAEGTEDVRKNRWTEPAVRELMKQTLRVQRAHEEVIRCNIEIRRLHTAIVDEHRLFDSVLKKLETESSPIIGAMAEHCQHRRRINAHILACLQRIYVMNGFSGNATPGVRDGAPPSVQSPTVDDVLQEECNHLDQDTAEQDEEEFGEEAAEEVGGVVTYLTELSPLSV